MDIRQLRHVAALHEHGSYARAAERLCLTQSALTRSIQGLEKEIGFRLFDRGRGGTHATAAGRQLAAEADDLIRHLHDIERNMMLLGNSEGGTAAFGMGPLPASLILPDLLTQAANEWPRLKLTVRSAGAIQLLDEMRSGALEFVVGARGLIEPHAPDLTLRQIGRVEIAALARRGHPLQGQSVTPEDLQHFPMIGGAADPDRRGSSASPYAMTITCDNYEIARAVTARTDAVWITARSLAGADLSALNCPSFEQSVQLVAASLARRTLSPPARRMIERAAQLLTGRAAS